MRSRTLLKLGMYENALLDADRVVLIKPQWSKVRPRNNLFDSMLEDHRVAI